MRQIQAPKENFLDKVIKFIDPVRARERLKARWQMTVVSAYTGASKSRRALTTWKTLELDADSAILSDLPTLRDRSADLLRNSPLALGAVNTACTNIIGTGLKIQARIDREVVKMSDDEVDKWESKVEREWRLWSESKDCDISRTLNFAGLQELAFRKVLEDGDVFSINTKVARKGNPYNLALQLVEAARVCNADNARDSLELAGGVERDSSGAPIAYHIMKQHPGSNLYGKPREWDKVPAFGNQTGMRNVLHLYRVLRPGQSRGVPYLAPVIETIKQLDKYTEAEVMAAVIQSMFTVFVKTEMGGMGLAPMTGDEGVDASQSASDKDFKLASGAIVSLRPGESIETANPTRPNSAFDVFMKAILQQVGVALEIPFEILVGHFSASYSASRAALLEAWRFFKGRRKWLADNFCQAVYENWLYEAVALGRISAPGYFGDPILKKAFSGALWIGDAPSQIDPLKEIDAAGKRIEIGISTMDEETTNLTGGDFETNYPRILKERRMMRDAGMWITAPEKANPQIIMPDGGPINENP
jgi:lambda family phage portal protein